LRTCDDDNDIEMTSLTEAAADIKNDLSEKLQKELKKEEILETETKEDNKGNIGKCDCV